jgi:hypothetical protein
MVAIFSMLEEECVEVEEGFSAPKWAIVSSGRKMPTFAVSVAPSQKPG